MSFDILDEGFEREIRKPDSDREIAEQIRVVKIAVNGNIEDILIGRGTFIVLAAFALFKLINHIYFGYSPDINLLLSFICLITYILCIWNVKPRPKVSLIFGLSFYIFTLVLHFFLIQSTIFFKVIMSAPVIYFLGSGIMASNELKKNLTQLSSLGMGSKELKEVAQLRRFEKT